jgi:hypothetical protein
MVVMLLRPLLIAPPGRTGTRNFMLQLSFLVLLLLQTTVALNVMVTIKNECPADINVILSVDAPGTMVAPLGIISGYGGTSDPQPLTGGGDYFIYSDANGGSLDGFQTTMAGFRGFDATNPVGLSLHHAPHGKVDVRTLDADILIAQNSYYYIVIDPSRFNTAISIRPVGLPVCIGVFPS